MNVYNQKNTNNNIKNINSSQTKEKNKNNFAVLSNLEGNKNRFYSENQRNLTKFNSQKKIRKKEMTSKNKTNNDNKSNAILIDNNILKNYSNLIAKTSKCARNSRTSKNSEKSHHLSKPQLEIEINNINSTKVSKNMSKITGNKKYKKNISEHDLINNLLTSFANYNLPKSTNNTKINFSSKKKLSYDTNKNKNKTKIKRDNTFDSKMKQNKSNKNISKTRLPSDTKLFRSSSGYSYINSHLSQTNSFLSGNQSNHLGYISTWGNSPDLTSSNFANMIKTSNKKKGNNKHNKNGNKGPIIGKIIKNYKNNDLNCIFNMNLIPPVSSMNNMQDYLKNLYKMEYNSEYRYKKHKNNIENLKENNNNNIKRNKDKEKDKDKDKETKTKSNNDDYSQSKNTNTMTKTNESKTKKEKDSIDNIKYCTGDTPEEIHFYIINSVQNGKNMIHKLNKK